MNEQQRGNGVLPGLELAWALHARGGGAEPKQGLSVGRIVAAAIEVADTEGLGAVSMSRVAKGLGFTTMSLYRHVRSKDELVLLMQDVAIGSPADLDPTPPGAGWRAQLERWVWGVLAALRRHPWIIQTIPMFGAPATPNQLSWLERGLRALEDTGLDEGVKVNVVMLLDALAFGDLQIAGAEQPTLPQVPGVDPYRELFGEMLDPAEFPALLRAVRGGAFVGTDDPVADRDEAFRLGVSLMLDGIERLVERRTGGRLGG
jgi:AcrR family transcriptional regulator